MNTQDSLILLVDDTQANLHLLSRVLSKEGFEYLAASNGKEAIELAKEHEPDLILLDIMMPDMSGFEVANHLKDIPEVNDVPIIFLSSLTETDDKVQAFKAGGVDYITKPFQKEETLARITTHLHIRYLRKQLNERINVLREREIELNRLNKKKDELVRTVSHDIKNPLTGIIGLVKLLKESDSVTGEEKKQMLSVIEESGTNLLNLVREVLDRESNKVEAEELNLEQVVVHDIVDRVVAMNKAKAIVKEIELSCSVEPKDIQANLDASKIEIAINNLVSNALKFTASGGHVSIKVHSDDPELFIKVIDNGIGIPKKIQPSLFAKDGYTTAGTSGEMGTGLGLDIVQLYVESHGGHISVDSELDKGTTFSISLPWNRK